MRWGLFQTAEYINMIVLSGLCVTLFFGGWHFPLVRRRSTGSGRSGSSPSSAVLVTAFIWLRATQPRLRYDQLMRFGWKVLLPGRDRQRHRHRLLRGAGSR